MHAYYAKTPHYLYELSYWESSRSKRAWFQVVLKTFRKRGIKRVLDFGGGVGGLSVFLRMQGIECDHLDVPGKTRDYATWRFKRHGLDVRVLDATAPQTCRKKLMTPSSPGTCSNFATDEGHHEHIHLAKHACYHDLRRFSDLLTSRNFLIHEKNGVGPR